MARTRWMVLALLLASLLVFSGCSSSSSPSAPAPDFNSGVNAPAEDTAAEEAPSYEGEKGSDEAVTGSGTLDPGNVADSGKKVIYTAEMSVEAEDARIVVDAVMKAVEEAGGYVSASDFYEASYGHRGSVTARIPPEQLKAFSAKVGALGRVTNSRLMSQDVTAQYTDTEAQLRNAKAQEVQLLEVLKKAVKIEDILDVRRELNAVQSEIERCQGQLRLYDNQVGYSTVYVELTEPERPTVTQDDGDRGVQFWGFGTIGAKIALAFRSSVNWTANAIGALLMLLGYLSVPLLIGAVLVIVIVLLVRHYRRRNPKKGPQPPQNPQPK